MRFKLETIIVLFYTCVLVYYVDTQEVTTSAPVIEEILVDDEKNHTWTSRNFPQAYPQENKTFIVKVGLGYSISIIIVDLDLDSTSGDFLIIKAGTRINDENVGKVFTYNLKDAKKYVIDSANVIMSFQVLGKNDAGKKGFSLVYKREGVVPATEVPVTEITWPTPSETDRIYFTGNISGRSQDDFENNTIVLEFKSAVAQMATEYCIAQNISFKDNITNLNVHIKNLINCPFEWPKSSTCVKIRFSIPIFLNEESNTTGYELTTDNLELMWLQYGNKFLNQFSMSVYEEPNPDTNLLLWLLISCLVIIIFIVFILIARSASGHISPLKAMKRRSSDAQGIVKNEMRASNMSLSPHPLQVIPPFFDVDSSFSCFEPDISESKKQYDYFSDDESENEITISKFNNSRNNITDNYKTESTT